jgi:hypothetical protein
MSGRTIRKVIETEPATLQHEEGRRILLEHLMETSRSNPEGKKGSL